MAGDKTLTLWREAGEPERVCSGEGAAPVAPKSSPQCAQWFAGELELGSPQQGTEGGWGHEK